MESRVRISRKPSVEGVTDLIREQSQEKDEDRKGKRKGVEEKGEDRWQ